VTPVLSRRRRPFVVSLTLALLLTALLPGTADAQRRAVPRRVQPRPVVVVRPVYRVPFYRAGFYRPWYAYQWGPYGYPYPPYGYGYYRDALTTSLKLEITPREAEVYVDGYFAGHVDDFDGIFQRLRLRPGEHELVIYLEGYRTIREPIYLSSGADRTIRRAMAPLTSGETSEPPPPPADREELPSGPDEALPPGSYVAPGGPESGQTVGRARFGTLSLRIQPADAEVFIDGQRWETPAAEDRITVQLAEGRHRLEVRKAGFSTYAEDVLIRRGGTLALNVSLTTGPA
jgi:hypothetical protein